MVKFFRNCMLFFVACVSVFLMVAALAANSDAMSKPPPMEETRANLDAKLDLPPQTLDPAKYIGDFPGGVQLYRTMDYELGVACYGLVPPKATIDHSEIADKLTCVQIQPN